LYICKRTNYNLWITSTVDNAHNRNEIFTLEICFKQLDVSTNSENIKVWNTLKTEACISHVWSELPILEGLENPVLTFKGFNNCHTAADCFIFQCNWKRNLHIVKEIMLYIARYRMCFKHDTFEIWLNMYGHNRGLVCRNYVKLSHSWEGASHVSWPRTYCTFNCQTMCLGSNRKKWNQQNRLNVKIQPILHKIITTGKMQNHWFPKITGHATGITTS